MTAVAEDSKPVLMLPAALWWASKGIPVFPLHNAVLTPMLEWACSCGDPCEKGSPAKHPRTVHGLHDASTDPAVITAWWERWPEANIGLRTGVTFDLLDIDGPAGFEALAELEKAVGAPQAVCVVESGRADGGRHYYMAPAGLGTLKGGRTSPKGIDVKGDGGYVVAPPSQHVSGFRYTMTKPYAADEASGNWAAVHAWLIDSAPRKAVDPVDVGAPATAREDRTDGWRKRAATWCQRALEGVADELAAMGENSGRNDYLNDQTWRMLRYARGGHLEPDAVLETMRDAASRAGLSDGEITGTLRSAARAADRDGALDPPVDELDAPNPDSEESFRDLWTPPEPPPPLTAEEAAAAALSAHEQMVAKELAVLRARDEARRIFEAEKAAAQFRVPPNRPTLAEELLIPSKPVQFRIDKLLPIGGNVLLPAQYKSGKTTTVNNLVASYADGEPFLGKFEMFPAEGRIAVWNYEVGEDQYREWLRAVGVKHPERVVVLNLRGFRVPITVPSVEDWCVDWLRRHEVSVWVMDPFARAATGVDENSNTEVGVWLDTFDVIKARAGVQEGILPTHTGRAEQEAGQERARGATRLDDWADVRWILTRDEAGARFFRATGRDVEVEEEKLSWDAETRRSTFGGWDRKGEAKRRLEDAVVAYIAENPGCSGEELEKQSGISPQKGILAARDRALASHRIRVEEVGSRGRKNHYANLI